MEERTNKLILALVIVFIIGTMGYSAWNLGANVVPLGDKQLQAENMMVDSIQLNNASSIRVLLNNSATLLQEIYNAGNVWVGFPHSYIIELHLISTYTNITHMKLEINIVLTSLENNYGYWTVLEVYLELMAVQYVFSFIALFVFVEVYRDNF